MWLGPAGQVVGGHNLYYGVLPPGFCTDTIALDLTLEDSQNPFWLYTKVAPWGVMYNNLDVLEKYSETEYLLTDNGSIFCRTPHNKQWYPTDIYCSITPDTVFLDFKLRERNDTIDRYVDSCKIAMPHI